MTNPEITRMKIDFLLNHGWKIEDIVDVDVALQQERDKQEMYNS